MFNPTFPQSLILTRRGWWGPPALRTSGRCPRPHWVSWGWYSPSVWWGRWWRARAPGGTSTPGGGARHGLTDRQTDSQLSRHRLIDRQSINWAWTDGQTDSQLIGHGLTDRQSINRARTDKQRNWQSIYKARTDRQRNWQSINRAQTDRQANRQSINDRQTNRQSINQQTDYFDMYSVYQLTVINT